MSARVRANKTRAEKSARQNNNNQDNPPCVNFADAIKIMLSAKPLPKRKPAKRASSPKKRKRKNQVEG